MSRKFTQDRTMTPRAQKIYRFEQSPYTSDDQDKKQIRAEDTTRLTSYGGSSTQQVTKLAAEGATIIKASFQYLFRPTLAQVKDGDHACFPIYLTETIDERLIDQVAGMYQLRAKVTGGF